MNNKKFTIIIMFCSLLIAAHNSTAQSNFLPSFQASRVFGSSGFLTPNAITSGDFNNDGKLDVILSDNSGNRLLLFYGQNNGEFSYPPLVISDIISPAGAVVSDFNGDGNKDIVVAADDTIGNNDGVIVLLGTGTGTFSTRFPYVTGNTTTDVVTADFNGDNKPDVAVANSSDATISVLFGNGNGSLTQSANYNTTGGARNLIAADFNNDNRPEIGFIRSGFKILPNTGNGTFSAEITINTSPVSSLGAVAVGNINGDANLDLVAVDTFFSSNNILPIFGNGNNSFTSGNIISINTTFSGVSIGDFNNDQKQDLAVSSRGKIYTFNGAGNGTFASPNIFYSGNLKPLLGDFNTDGWLDIISITPTELGGQGGGNFAVLLNKQNGLFNSAPAFNLGFRVDDLAAADINLDQRKDIIGVNGGPGGQSGTLNFALQNSTGGFNPYSFISLAINPSALVVADFNNDNKPDVIVGGFGVNGGTNNVAFAPGTGSGFGSQTNFQVGSGIYDIVASDFNNDGKLDVAYSATSSVFVALGNGNGTFNSPVSYFSTNSVLRGIAAEDFNNDGKADLAVSKNQTSEVATLINNGSGAFTFGAAYQVGTFPHGVSIADLNGDQNADLIVGADNAGIYVLRGNGTGSFGTPIQYEIPSIRVGQIGTGDFNKDNKIDVVATSFQAGAVVFTNDGTGNLIGQRTWATARNPISLVLTDFNNDQKLDFAVGGVDPGDFSILLNNTTTGLKNLFDFDGDNKTDVSIFRPSVGEWWYLRSSDNQNRAFQFGNGSDKIMPADFTGDGKTDIAFWRPSSGEWFVLRSEDNSFYSFPFGTNGDIPAVGDFDADGKADAAVFRPSAATWYISLSSGGTTIQQFGANGDFPTVADYDGDGKTDLAIFRPATGDWWIKRSSSGATVVYQFGNSTDKPVQGDYTGDGKADVAFFRPSSSEWFILRSENLSFFSFPFGASGDIPVPGDYDGDGKIDAAVFRPGETNWYLQRSTAGFTAVQFGLPTDKPVPSALVP